MPSSDDSHGLAGRILTDVQALVARLATLRADANVLSNLAQGVAMTVADAVPAPTTPAGTAKAAATVGHAPEAA
ncbi:hypothetical protein OG203_17470 [Nocardia sp. NBC_01499]|uniref:hypothetical protein n=1 Tax=Nocardia sp. NBC_01499 TaxID=2903597 RepID=UPI00386AE404